LYGGILSALLALIAAGVPLVAAASPLLLIAFAFYAYAICRRDLITAKQREGWFEGIETAVSGRISSQAAIQGVDVPVPTIPWLAIIGSLALIAAGVITVATRWAEVPDVIATHWGPRMQPDAWADKSIGAAFLPSFIGLGLVALLFFIGWTFKSSTVHQRTDRSIAGQLRAQALLAASTTGIGYLFLIISAGLAVTQICSVLPAYQDYMWLGLAITAGGALVGVLLLLINQLRAQTAMDAQLRKAGLHEQDAESPDNDKYYKWGMFYYNPNDPAVLVDKRFGTGIAFNYARWQAQAATGLLLASTIGVLAFAFLF
ncbi:MAG: DUF1648 domain-containing protein, partial [Corynebacterium flavescens]|uniref:DUF1648 domain-containing protein n=1 Tax=Corynebacterium flavescens TaxID=28028 RepID=UPI00264934A0